MGKGARCSSKLNECKRYSSKYGSQMEIRMYFFTFMLYEYLRNEENHNIT